MLNFDQIKQLIDIVCERDLSGIEVEETGFRLKIEGRPTAQPVVQIAATPAPLAVPAAAVAAEATAASGSPAGSAAANSVAAAAESDGRHVIHSPIVGTFYGSPSPDADSYVQVGDHISKGQVLCIVEAMKLMNEIESDVDGKVLEVLPKNAQPVEYGEPLFAIQSD